MSHEKQANSSAFGRQLRWWRQKRGMSQLDLASAAATTPRHLSFIESGRSRPGKQLVLRLAKSLDLPVRSRNELLIAAGLPSQFAERPLSEQQLEPFRRAVEQILASHNPYPACAMDLLGRVVTCNDAQRRLAPGCELLSAEEHLDMWFAPGPMRDSIVNWSEVAWHWVDRQLRVATNSNNERLSALVERAMEYLVDVDRPEPLPEDNADILTMRLRVGDQQISMFSTVMRFESAVDITLSELRVELMFPLDDESRQFFHELAKSATANNAATK